MAESVEEVVASVLGVPAGELSDDSSIGSVPSWDSLRQLSVILALESAYGTSISTDEALEMNSIAAIKQVLARHHPDAS